MYTGWKITMKCSHARDTVQRTAAARDPKRYEIFIDVQLTGSR